MPSVPVPLAAVPTMSPIVPVHVSKSATGTAVGVAPVCIQRAAENPGSTLFGRAIFVSLKRMVNRTILSGWYI